MLRFKLPSSLGAVAAAVAVAAIVTFFSAGVASSDVVRHCRAYISTPLTGGIAADGRPFVAPGTSLVPAALLEGRGTCRGRAWGNDCRRAARNAIVNCARRTWERRWDRSPPSDACGSWHDVRPPHAGFAEWGPGGTDPAVQSTLNGDIKTTIEYTMCCRRNPTARRLSFNVRLHVFGDSGCEHDSALLDGQYEADCEALRRQGLCGAPRRTN